MTGLMLWVNNAMLIIGFIAGLAFVILYGARYLGARHWLGVHLVSFSAVVTAFYGLFIARPWLSPNTYMYVRFILFVLLTVVVVWRLAVLVKFREVEHGTPEEQPETP